jgi:pimeloyl-ACP methyl ester carboxylesterase
VRRWRSVVLLLHGQILDGRIFDALGARLARRWRVLVPDLPGHGRSPPLAPFSLEGVRVLLEHTLLQRRVRSVALVGYSLGGYHALALALAGRVPVERLALVGAVAGLDAPTRAGPAGFAHAVRAGLDVGQVFAGVALPEAWAAAHPDVAAALVTRANEASRETLVTELDAMGELPDLRPKLGAIAVPTLVRVGALDRTSPPSSRERSPLRSPARASRSSPASATRTTSTIPTDSSRASTGSCRMSPEWAGTDASRRAASGRELDLLVRA